MENSKKHKHLKELIYREEHEKFETFLDRFIDDALDEGERCPVEFPENHFYELELN